MTRQILICTAAFAAVAGLARAETPVELEEIIVTASRLPAPLAATPGARVIGEAEIEARGAVFAADALADAPGVSLYRNGAFGGVTSIRLRGASADKTLVLVDGAPMNDASHPTGGYDFAGLDLGDVERIEILAGPQGALWGSDAIGGVIAFTTREPDGFRADLEAGSLDTARLSVATGLARDDWAVGLAASSFTTDGVSRADVRDGNTETDGFDNRTLSLSGRLRAGPAVELRARYRFSDSRAELDGYPAPLYRLADTDEVSDTTNSVGSLQALIADPWGFEHQLSWSRSEVDRTIRGGDFPSHYVGRRQLARWQAHNPTVTDRLGLAFGIEHETAEGDLSTGRRERQRAAAGFVVARYALGADLDLTGSVRLDDPDRYGAETTARLAASWRPVGGWRLAAAWGQGFKTPTISQSVCDFCFSTSPYPILTPERAEGFDLEAAWRAPDGRFAARLGLWRLEVEDQIVFFTDPATFESDYRNIARTEADGVELEASARLGGGFELRGAWSWIDARDSTTGARLPMTPGKAGSLGLDWRGGPWRAGLRVRAEAEQVDVGGVRDGFVTADLTAGWAVNDHVELTARIVNLADAAYQEALGYGEPGRTGYLGLRLRY